MNIDIKPPPCSNAPQNIIDIKYTKNISFILSFSMQLNSSSYSYI